MSTTSQGTITLYKLRTGQTMMVNPVIEKGLAQTIVKGSTPNPNWSQAENQPSITIKVSSSDGSAATISEGNWYYNGEGDGYNVTKYPKLFKVENGGAKITIINNLASKDNYADDTLTFVGTARVNGYEYSITKTFNIAIALISDSSYSGQLIPEKNQITTKGDTIKIVAYLYGSNGKIDAANYNVEWSGKAGDVFTETGDNGHEIQIGEKNVNNQQLFIAKFRLEGASDVIAYSSVLITDVSDTYIVNLETDLEGGSQNYPDTIKGNVKVTASVKVRKSDGTIEGYTKEANWKMYARNYQFDKIEGTEVSGRSVEKELTINNDILKAHNTLHVTAEVDI